MFQTPSAERPQVGCVAIAERNGGVMRLPSTQFHYVNLHPLQTEAAELAHALDFYSVPAIMPGEYNFFMHLQNDQRLWKDGVYQFGLETQATPLTLDICRYVTTQFEQGRTMVVFPDFNGMEPILIDSLRSDMLDQGSCVALLSLPEDVWNSVSGVSGMISLCHQSYFRCIYNPGDSEIANLDGNAIKVAAIHRQPYMTRSEIMLTPPTPATLQTYITFDDFLRLYKHIFPTNLNGTSLQAQSFSALELEIAWRSENVYFTFGVNQDNKIIGFYAGITELGDPSLLNTVHTVNPSFMSDLNLDYVYTMSFGILPTMRGLRFFNSGGIHQMYIYILESLKAKAFGGDVSNQYPSIRRNGNAGILKELVKGLGVTSKQTQQVVDHHYCMLV